MNWHLVILVFLDQDSKPGQNQYGANPKRPLPNKLRQRTGYRPSLSFNVEH